jgi:hypothetical protein
MDLRKSTTISTRVHFEINRNCNLEVHAQKRKFLAGEQAWSASHSQSFKFIQILIHFHCEF